MGILNEKIGQIPILALICFCHRNIVAELPRVQLGFVKFWVGGVSGHGSWGYMRCPPNSYITPVVNVGS